MANVSKNLAECISLPPKEILSKFKAGIFTDKTFSKLYAPCLSIPTTQGLVLEFKQKNISKCYSVMPEIKNFLDLYNNYVIRYDFRAQFKELEQWMKEKQFRPKHIRCSKENVTKQIKMSIEKGCSFADDFFLIISGRIPHYNHIMCTIRGELAYIEYSDDFEASHGLRDSRLCIIEGKKPVFKEFNISTDLLLQTIHFTRNITKFIGDNATCEFSFGDNTFYLVSGQKSSEGKGIPVRCGENIKVVSAGAVEGVIKKVSKRSIPDIISELSKTEDKYVFLAERPHSDFVDILKFAKGFIFDEGSILCHLAILLREKNIPAKIISYSTMRYKNGDNVNL